MNGVGSLDFPCTLFLKKTEDNLSLLLSMRERREDSSLTSPSSSSRQGGRFQLAVSLDNFTFSADSFLPVIQVLLFATDHHSSTCMSRCKFLCFLSCWKQNHAHIQEKKEREKEGRKNETKRERKRIESNE